MRNEDILIIIGGASGVGKTALVKAIEKRGIAVYEKIHEIALEMASKIAEEKGVDIKTAFELLEDSKIIEDIIAFTKRYHHVLSDLHYAIQPKSDTTRLIRMNVNDKMLVTEEYEPAFTAFELSTITNQNIILVPILITCDANEIVERLIEMNLQNPTQIPRSLKREIVQQECTAELNIYLSLMRELGLQPRIFANTNGQFDKFQEEIMNFLMALI